MLLIYHLADFQNWGNLNKDVRFQLLLFTTNIIFQIPLDFITNLTKGHSNGMRETLQCGIDQMVKGEVV